MPDCQDPPKNLHITVKIAKRDREALDKEAERLGGISLSAVVRMLIRKLLTQSKAA